MQPMNYTLQTESPGDAFQKGFQNTGAMMATVAEYQKAQQLATLAQQKAEMEAQKRADFAEAAMNPTRKGVQSLMLKYPELHEGIGKSLQSLNDNDKRTTKELGSSLIFALTKGKTDTAVNMIDQYIDSAKNSGDSANLERFEMLRNAVQSNPDGALFSLHGIMNSVMDGKEYADWSKGIEEVERLKLTKDADVRKAGAEATKAEADAVTAQAKARFADSDAAIELQKKGWDIKKIQADIDIAKQNSRIAAMNAQTSRMNSGLQAQELQLKLGEAIQKRDESVRNKAAEVEAARFNIDNMLNTADRVLKTPKGVISSAAGPISSRIPTMSSDTADFEALVESLGSQAFLSQLPNIKGMGQLSNAEGDKLQAALQNMSLKQSPERLVENVKEAQRLLLKVRKNVANRYGVPDTVPDTPEAKPSGASIDALLKKYGQ